MIKHHLIKHEQVSSSDKCELEGIHEVAHFNQLFVPSILETVAVHKQACRKPVHKRPENGKQETPSKETRQKKAPKVPKALLSWLPKFLGLWALPDTHQSGTSLLEHLSFSLEQLDDTGCCKSNKILFCALADSLLLCGRCLSAVDASTGSVVCIPHCKLDQIEMHKSNHCQRPCASKFLCTKAPGSFTSQQLGCLPFTVDSGRASKEF